MYSAKRNNTELGLAKLGNIVAETMFLIMFLGVAKLGSICFGSKNVFDSKQKHVLFASDKICFRNTFPAQLNWETFASATMFLSLAKPLVTTPQVYATVWSVAGQSNLLQGRERVNSVW